MLHGHTDRVNCVQWVGPRSGSARYTAEQRGCVELASGSVDKNVIIWQRPHGLTSSPLVRKFTIYWFFLLIKYLKNTITLQKYSRPLSKY